MRFRLAQSADLAQIMIIIKQAQEYLKMAGIDQWQNGYPSEAIIRQDLEQKNSYVLVDSAGFVVATAVLEFTGDPNYEIIQAGSWLSAGPYGAIHRIAVESEQKGSGLAGQIIQEMIALCYQREVFSLRVDTHSANDSMQKMLLKAGFQYCGIIHLADNSPRVAYEKVLPNIKKGRG